MAGEYIEALDTFEGFVGSSEAMRQLYSAIRRIAANNDTTILLYGESGTGKELGAEAIHALSRKPSQGTFVKTNCAAFPEQLLESELFGHVRGAFTGAIADRIGCFEAAQGGTLFLDEIGDIPLATQVRLLRVLEEKKIQRLGSVKVHDLSLRIIAATNKNLAEEVRFGRFRADLFYRIAGITITLPSLRERREDIPALVEYFIELLNQRSKQKKKGITAHALNELIQRPWYGNVRELKSVIERAFIFCERDCIDVIDLAPNSYAAHWPFCGERRKGERRLAAPPIFPFPPSPNMPHKVRKGRISRETLIQALEENRWHIGRTAASLNIHRTTLWRYMCRAGFHKALSLGAI